jgi:hypothetical protein
MSALLTYFFALRNVFSLPIFSSERKAAAAANEAQTVIFNDLRNAGNRTPRPDVTGENHGIRAF